MQLYLILSKQKESEKNVLKSANDRGQFTNLEPERGKNLN